MKLQDYIVIKGKVWTIKRLNLESYSTYDDKGNQTGHAVGLCEAHCRTILIHNKLSKDLEMETFIHELGHAIFHEIGFGQTSFSSDFEEIIVENFAGVLVGITKTFTLKKPHLVSPTKKKKK